MQDDEEDFYMVLPSNGCPDTHPENEANNYVISWEQPIQMNATKRKVALTEANFSYTMSSMSTMFGIRVERKWLTNLGFRIKLTGDIEQRKLSLTFPDIVKMNGFPHIMSGKMWTLDLPLHTIIVITC